MCKSNLATININGREYARAIDLAKDLGYGSGKMLINKYGEYALKMFGLELLPCDLFYKTARATFVLYGIRAISCNSMNNITIKHKQIEDNQTVPKIKTSNTNKYKHFQTRVKNKVKRELENNKNMFDGIDFTKTLKFEVIHYICPKSNNGNLTLMDCSNPLKATEDAIFSAIKLTLGLSTFDDKLNTFTSSRIIDVESKKEEMIVVSISNDDYDKVSDFTRNNRCKEIAEELKMKMIK